jgi:hypothetical protein
MKSIYKLAAVLCVGMTLASCTTTERTAGLGAVGGAIIGGAVTGDIRGAAVGAGIGGVSGAVIGHASEQRPDTCYYRDRYGNRYMDYC